MPEKSCAAVVYLALALLPLALLAGCSSAVSESKLAGPTAGKEPPPPPPMSFVRIGEVTPVREAEALPDGDPTTPLTSEALPLPPPQARPGKDPSVPDGVTAAAPKPPIAASQRPPPPAETKIKGAVVDSTGGLTESDVRDTIVQNQSSFRRCYELGQQSSGAFSGSVTLRVDINALGVVAQSKVVGSTTRNMEVDSCVANAVHIMQFPKKGSGAVVTFPVDFGRS
jgi:hypothetical protein